MAILIILFLFHFIVGQLLEISESKTASYFFNILLLVFVFYFSLGVTDTNDMFMYNYFYDKQIDDYDPMFIFLSKLLNTFQLPFADFYKFHIIVYTFTYLFFITRYTTNFFYVFLVFFALYYVPYVNQIRYYMAFPFFLLSLHYFLNKRNLFLFILFTLLAVLSHSAVVILYLFIPMYYFLSTKYFFRISLITSATLLIVVVILFQMGIVQQLEHFGEYFSKGETSSVFGGVFNALPYVIYIVYLLLLDRKYRNKNPDFGKDKTYAILSKLSFFTIVFIPSSFITQVLGHRYVFPFLIVWVIYFLYMIRKENKQQKFISFVIFAGVHILVGSVMYILPLFVFGKSFYEDELIRGLKSIEYIDYLF